MSNILVTGATGTQGGAVARQLLSRGHGVRAMTRHTGSEAAVALQKLGAEVVQGDFGSSDSLRSALRGVDAAFVMGTPYAGAGVDGEIRHAKALIDAVRDTGGAHVVYSSAAGADRGTGIPHNESKFEVEQYLKASGLDWTVIGPTAFVEAFIAPWGLPLLREGVASFFTRPETPMQWISVEDIGRFAAHVLGRTAEFTGQRIDIASFEATGSQIAAAFEGVRYEQMPVDRSAGEELWLMTELFEKRAVVLDIPALHAKYPSVGWYDLPTWVRERAVPALR
ncbi:NmrA/HSCARG family protein [Streptomyces piniterrae]|nr:NmrA/HSCARG family protein [Streptomyces piniterrae]